MTDETKAYLTAMLEEYKTLRDESKQASINMFAALQLGAGFVAVALAAAFTQWGKSAAIAVVVFMVLVPLLAAFSMFIWLGEAIRFRRVGDYLSFLEQKIGLLFETSGAVSPTMAEQLAVLQKEAESKLGFVPSPILMSDPLAWEQWLRNTRASGWKALVVETSGHQQLVYLTRLAFFPFIMLLSYGVGVYYVSRYPPSPSAIVDARFLSLHLPRIDYVLVAEWIGLLVILLGFLFGGIIAWRLVRKAGVIRRAELLGRAAGHPKPPNPPLQPTAPGPSSERRG